ncbi:TPA: citramalate synthase [Candidatus Sumerlaeota bacterium]|jgi:2-isopropylmalate synthase|nr:citramalate synthase [Candidatus Sumerlaeota bacterium]
MSHPVFIYDTTLRDGAQAENISFSLQDSIQIARLLDDFGVHFIEGGQAESNPKVARFFEEMRKTPLKNAKLATFGMTRRKHTRAEDDTNLATMLSVKTPVVTLVGKTWDLHVTKGLQTTLDENLAMISDSVHYMKSKQREVVYDAEHFFDGYKANPDYALKTLAAAAEAGADWLALCETNGGVLPHEVAEITAIVRKMTTVPIGIHCHNDTGMAAANSLMAVINGATQIQGTINGYGERTGNADLSVIIPSVMLKLKRKCVPLKSLKRITEFSRTIDEIANQAPNPRQPYVGRCAFAHKGGMHVSALQRDQTTYEHIVPDEVGNQRRVLISDLSGRSNIQYKIAERGLESDGDELKKLLSRVKQMESEGYTFEAAEASFDVLAARLRPRYKQPFSLDGFRVIVEKRGHEEPCVSEATVKVNVDGKTILMAGEGDGPVNALDEAVRKALTNVFPQLKDVKLVDYKVRVLDEGAGTAAKVRVLIESGDGQSQWGTVGVSENLIEASWRALVDSLEYKLMKK